jgi:hypothetical protein
MRLLMFVDFADGLCMLLKSVDYEDFDNLSQNHNVYCSANKNGSSRVVKYNRTKRKSYSVAES